ncbi:hypothetical protein CGRA01v4_06462 [Colletotrichum graminicola]|nr:hypothetical protein CGRA01v4_06462 [Colletotrichum graminicola]
MSTYVIPGGAWCHSQGAAAGDDAQQQQPAAAALYLYMSTLYI